MSLYSRFVTSEVQELFKKTGFAKRYETLMKSVNSSSTPGTGTNLVPINLDLEAKNIYPTRTPLQNLGAYAITNGEKGVDYRYRAIKSVNSSQLSGFAPETDGTSSISGLASLITNPVVSKTVNMGKLAPRSQVTWELYNQSGPFNALAIETMASLVAAKENEEMAALGANATAIAAPTTVTATGSGTGGTMPAATYTVKVSAVNYYRARLAAASGYAPEALSSGKRPGESARTAASGVALSGSTSKLTVTWTDCVGAFGYVVFVNDGTDEKYVGFYTGNGCTITAFPATTNASAATTDASNKYLDAESNFTTYPYDGLYPLMVTDTDITAQYTSQGNAALSAYSGGSGITEFETIFQNIYKTWYASPDYYICGPSTQAQISNLVLGATSPNYFLTVPADGDGNVKGGTVLLGVRNQYAGSMVKAIVHPLMPEGKVVFYTQKINTPQSNVSTNLAYHTGTHFQQDFYARTVDVAPPGPWAIKSYGTFALYNPGVCGAITNILVS